MTIILLLVVSLSEGCNPFNSYPSEINHFNFQPREVVYRYRDPRLHVAENY